VRITYETKKFHPGSLAIIEKANEICADYQAQGYDLTLRQLYYQFVARALLPNNDKSYNRLGSIVNDARMAGKMDWNYIVDRTRNLRTIGMWDSPQSILDAVALQFRTDRWNRQSEYVEVWIEKDALVGVLGDHERVSGVCPENGVPFFSCRGYTSQSEMWGAAQRLGKKIRKGKRVTILHLGDHDPSGIDMTRDIEDRLNNFLSVDLRQLITSRQFSVDRIALTMRQVEQYDPPPNPAKLTDARAAGYIEEYGDSSWELDALDPATLTALIQSHIDQHRDQELWDEAESEDQEARDTLAGVSNNWEDVQEFVARLVS
jgi:hypothetical protein